MASDKPTSRLRELKGSGYEIKKGQPDIRGWDVRDESGRKFGKVRELIFDLKAHKVRYMVVDVADVRELELEKRTVLIPIGFAQLDGSDDDVILHGVTPFQVRALPRYDKSNLGGKTERDISQVFGREHTAVSGSGDDMGDSFYEHDHFNEDNMYNRREEKSLRRETEMEPVSLRDSDDLKKFEKEERLSGETEEEYKERMRKNRSENPY